MWVGEPFCLILNDSLLRMEFLVNSTRLFLVLLLLLLQISSRFFKNILLCVINTIMYDSLLWALGILDIARYDKGFLTQYLYLSAPLDMSVIWLSVIRFYSSRQQHFIGIRKFLHSSSYLWWRPNRIRYAVSFAKPSYKLSKTFIWISKS